MPSRRYHKFFATRLPPHLGDLALRGEPRFAGAHEAWRMEEREDGVALCPCERRPSGPDNCRPALGKTRGPPKETTEKYKTLNYLGTVAYTLGKGEVECSIHSGSTIRFASRPVQRAGIADHAPVAIPAPISACPRHESTFGLLMCSPTIRDFPQLIGTGFGIAFKDVKRDRDILRGRGSLQRGFRNAKSQP